jgi:quercetin dioxygenase-like cupin family protein
MPKTRGPLDDELLDEMRAERADTMRGPDSAEGHELAAAIGKNLARFRELRSLDLAGLSKRTGIREDLLAALECGHAVPSLRAVWHLATALQVPFGSMLAETLFTTGGDPDFRVQRADRGRVIRDASGRFRSRVLFLEGDPRSPEVYQLTLQPGCVEDADPHAPETFEHITVVRGTLLVRCGEAEAHLGPGDTIFFRADVPHGYENRGSEECVAQLVMTYVCP